MSSDNFFSEIGHTKCPLCSTETPLQTFQESEIQIVLDLGQETIF